MTDKTLILEIKGGKERRMTIPADWVITFGPVAVGARFNGDDSVNCLRLYSDVKKTQLKAVFRNVVSFFEEGIEIREKVVRKKRKTFTRNEKNGAQSYQAEVRQTTWRDPFSDEEDEGTEFDLSDDALQLQALPAQDSDF